MHVSCRGLSAVHERRGMRAVAKRTIAIEDASILDVAVECRRGAAHLPPNRRAGQQVILAWMPSPWWVRRARSPICPPGPGVVVGIPIPERVADRDQRPPTGLGGQPAQVRGRRGEALLEHARGVAAGPPLGFAMRSNAASEAHSASRTGPTRPPPCAELIACSAGGAGLRRGQADPPATPPGSPCARGDLVAAAKLASPSGAMSTADHEPDAAPGCPDRACMGLATLPVPTWTAR